MVWTLWTCSHKSSAHRPIRATHGDVRGSSEAASELRRLGKRLLPKLSGLDVEFLQLWERRKPRLGV